MTMQDLTRRLAVVFTLLLVGLGVARAQGGTPTSPSKGSGGSGTGNEFDFSDIPVDEEKPPYIGVGGGYTGMFTWINLNELNKLAESLGMSDFTGGLWMNGGGGFTAIGVVPNLRLGVYGFNGSRQKSQEFPINNQSYTRTIRFSNGLTVAHIDYAIPLFRGFTVLPGTLIGAGSNTLEISQSLTSGTTFGTIADPAHFGGTSTGDLNAYARISRSYLAVTPTVNFEYAFTQFFMLRGGVSYALTAAPSDWTDSGDITITNVPSFKSDGLTAQIGIFVGLFQQ